MRKIYCFAALGVGILLLLRQYVTKSLSVGGLIYGLLLLIGIIIMSDIDIRKYEIPNKILLYFLVLGMLRIASDLAHLPGYLIAFLLMGGLLLAIAVLSGGKLGGGDIKLMAVAGLCLGLRDVFLALAVASLVGTLIGLLLIALKKIKKEDYLPFGPFLGAGIYLAYLYGHQLWNWYLHL